MRIQVKRVYEPTAKSDGFRVLVDRLWPRGLSKYDAKLDLWLPDLGPPTILRNWFNHDPARWAEFNRRYHAELKKKSLLLATITQQAKTRPVTLQSFLKRRSLQNPITRTPATISKPRNR